MVMTLVEIALVDLGANHNGRVVRRNIYEKADGRRIIVDRGRHIPVACINSRAKRRSWDIAYVTTR